MPGILWDDDYPTLVESVNACISAHNIAPIIRFVEVGVADQRTAADLYKHIDSLLNNRPWEYYCIDIIPMQSLGPHCRLVQGPSADVAPLVPSPIHWLFIDGCHCHDCVAKDTELYYPKLAPGGYLAYHDASPKAQGRDPQLYGTSHDMARAAEGIRVLSYLESPKFLRHNLRLVKGAPAQEYGGVQYYQAIKV